MVPLVTYSNQSFSFPALQKSTIALHLKLTVPVKCVLCFHKDKQKAHVRHHHGHRLKLYGNVLAQRVGIMAATASDQLALFNQYDSEYCSKATDVARKIQAVASLGIGALQRSPDRSRVLKMASSKLIRDAECIPCLQISGDPS